jgi:hypothetical protein
VAHPIVAAPSSFESEAATNFGVLAEQSRMEGFVARTQNTGIF